MNSSRLILNIGSGKLYRSDNLDKGNCYIFLDRSYAKGYHFDIAKIEEEVVEWMDGGGHSQTIFCGCDVFEFMDNFKFRFDEIYAYRIFEHMEYCSGEIGRLLEACNMLSTENSILDIIVPNALLLADILIKYDKDGIANYNEKKNAELIVNSEFNNIKQDPHASVWTSGLAKSYILSEATWKIHDIQEQITYENRNIYMRILCYKNNGNEIFKSIEKFPLFGKQQEEGVTKDA